MFKQLSLIIAYTFIRSVVSQAAGESSSQPASNFICDSSKTNQFKIGEKVSLCLHLLPRKMKVRFDVIVDTYEMLTVSGIYHYVSRDSLQEYGFLFQLGNTFTPHESTYFNSAKSVITLKNIVIRMNKGELLGISWDNDCWDCEFGVKKCKTSSKKGIFDGYSYTEKVIL